MDQGMGMILEDPLVASLCGGVYSQFLHGLVASGKIVHCHLFTQGGKVLLFRRSDDFWGPISGRVKLNEKYIETAIRECEEETLYIKTSRGNIPEGPI